ncbi:hypothetical protein [Gallaecimonas xiamenensis]|uniref:Uncharacterized protein n=1 Tax=Gallaecimonas xiamenensis 3-C-1 TaxID=745411 RepID=K2JC38_9GAMM|nr:hypothetical protein [Gallaecimonas xiamenensis]EKE72372.1 hypothetical protein B3C1_11087 [Gallaecimonas xiamenensis 3-C-1]
MVAVALLFDPNGFQEEATVKANWLARWPQGQGKRKGPFLLLASQASLFTPSPQGPALLLGEPLAGPDIGALLKTPLVTLPHCQGHFALLAPVGNHYLAAGDRLGLVPLYKRDWHHSWLISSDPGFLAAFPGLTLDPESLFDWLSLGAPLEQHSLYRELLALPCQHYWLDGRLYPYQHKAAPKPADPRPVLDWHWQAEAQPQLPEPNPKLARWLLGDSDWALARQRWRLERWHQDQALQAHLWRWHWQDKAARQGLSLAQWALPRLATLPSAIDGYPRGQRSGPWPLLRQSLLAGRPGLAALFNPEERRRRLAREHWLFKPLALT